MTTKDQAVIVWSVLAFAAQEQKVITYERLAGVTGIPRNGFAECLGHIHRYCDRKKLPNLNKLVIGKLGKPGKGIPFKTSVDDALRAHLQIFAVDWSAKAKPKTGDFY